MSAERSGVAANRFATVEAIDWPLVLDVGDGFRLVSAEAEDAARVYALADANRDHLMPWVPWVTERMSIEGTRSWLARTVEERERGSDFTFLIVEGAEPRGMLSLVHVDATNRSAEVSYWLVRDAVGRGVLSRALQALLAQSFGALDLNRITLQCAVQNGPSQAVAERNGFQREGILREVEWHPLGWVDLCLYSILRRDFAARDVATAR